MLACVRHPLRKESSLESKTGESTGAHVCTVLTLRICNSSVRPQLCCCFPSPGQRAQISRRVMGRVGSSEAARRQSYAWGNRARGPAVELAHQQFGRVRKCVWPKMFASTVPIAKNAGFTCSPNCTYCRRSVTLRHFSEVQRQHTRGAGETRLLRGPWRGPRRPSCAASRTAPTCSWSRDPSQLVPEVGANIHSALNAAVSCPRDRSF